MKQYNAVKAVTQMPFCFQGGWFYETFGEDAIGFRILELPLPKGQRISKLCWTAGFPTTHWIPTSQLVRAGQRLRSATVGRSKLTRTLSSGNNRTGNPGSLTMTTSWSIARITFWHRSLRQKNGWCSFPGYFNGEFLTAEGSFETSTIAQFVSTQGSVVSKGQGSRFYFPFWGKYYTFSQTTGFIPMMRPTTADAAFRNQVAQRIGVMNWIRNYRFRSNSALPRSHATSPDQAHCQLVSLKRTIRVARPLYHPNLELFNSINEGAKTLVQVIDKTISPMGARC